MVITTGRNGSWYAGSQRNPKLNGNAGYSQTGRPIHICNIGFGFDNLRQSNRNRVRIRTSPQYGNGRCPSRRINISGNIMLSIIRRPRQCISISPYRALNCGVNRRWHYHGASRAGRKQHYY